MPTYGFLCLKCNKEHELVMKISEYDPETEYFCPDCGAKMIRVIDSANFQLVGSGWFNSGGY